MTTATLETLDHRLEYLEEINKLVTKDEFRESMRGLYGRFDAIDTKFDAMSIRITSLEGSLMAKIIMVDERITSMRWVLIIGFAFISILISGLGVLITIGMGLFG